MTDQNVNNPQDLDNDPQVQKMHETASILAALLFKSNMTNEEKQGWMNLIPLMTPEQLNSFQEVLLTEQLGKIEYEELAKLQSDIMDINEGYDQKILSAQEEALSGLASLEAEIDKLAEEK